MLFFHNNVTLLFIKLYIYICICFFFAQMLHKRKTCQVLNLYLFHYIFNYWLI